MSVTGYVAKGLIARHWKKILASIVGVVILFIVLLITLMQALNPMNMLGNIFGGGGQPVPQSVMQHENDIREELKKYDREEHTELVLAIITQESGGTGTGDIMQASESKGLPPNTIDNPKESIEVGVQYFDEVLTEAENKDVDLMTAIQSYNFGNGYIDYIAENGGEHSTELAQEFSDLMKEQTGWNTYGDPNYIEHVSQYIGASGGSIGAITPSGTLQHPYAGIENQVTVSSEFGNRIHPIYQTSRLHAGIDFSTGGRNLPIYAVENGVVTGSGFHHSAGNYVEITHSDTLKTRYLHLAQPTPLQIGQNIEKGDNIGITGTTGSSTGIHLHYEIHQNGQPINPRNYHDF